MAIQSINISDVNSANKTRKDIRQKAACMSVQPSFQGLETIPVVVADALYNGGFITSFIAQDFFGMAGPRVLEGINRRPVNPETGKKEGPYNWAFARREGIREILSGPSAFIIPACILHFVKKHGGTANNVPVDMIQGLGNTFVDYAGKNSSTLSDVAKTKRGFYEAVYDNLMHTTFAEGMPPEEELQKLRFTREDFANRAIEIEQAGGKKKSLFQILANKKVEGSPEDLTESFMNNYMELRKKHLSPIADCSSAEIVVNPEKIGKYAETLQPADKTGVSFKKLLKSMRDFSNDVVGSTSEALTKYKDKFEPEKFLKDFIKKRSGSRILTNMGMWFAVVSFYMFIPKLYSLGLKGKNPAFIHEQRAEEEKAKAQQTQKAQQAQQTFTSKASDKVGKGKDVSFTGKLNLSTKTAEKVLNSGKLRNFLRNFEFNDASMSVEAMLMLLFGFCLPPRLLNAPDKYDLKETILRDITSFLSILFAAQALSRGFSETFSKVSGLALNVKPANHDSGLWAKFKNYFSPSKGIKILDNVELDTKYVNVHNYKGGISGFFDFVSGNGGNLKKLLMYDNVVAEKAKVILGKDVKDVVNDKEIRDAFKNITGDEKQNALKAIEDVFKNSKNKYVKGAKLYNSMFTFLSTIVLVPAFMIWLARKCDKMTREARAKDLALAAAQNGNQNNPAVNASGQIQKSVNYSVDKLANINMQGFLHK